MVIEIKKFFNELNINDAIYVIDQLILFFNKKIYYVDDELNTFAWMRQKNKTFKEYYIIPYLINNDIVNLYNCDTNFLMELRKQLVDSRKDRCKYVSDVTMSVGV